MGVPKELGVQTGRGTGRGGTAQQTGGRGSPGAVILSERRSAEQRRSRQGQGPLAEWGVLEAAGGGRRAQGGA